MVRAPRTKQSLVKTDLHEIGSVDMVRAI
jgi:hypothetical protein